MATNGMQIDDLEPPSTSGRGPGGTAPAAGDKQPESAQHAGAAAAAPGGAAAAAPSRARGRRRRSLSADSKSCPNEDRWWLSESEAESDGGGGDSEEEELAAARRPLPPEEQDPLYDPTADDEVGWGRGHAACCTWVIAYASRLPRAAAAAAEASQTCVWTRTRRGRARVEPRPLPAAHLLCLAQASPSRPLKPPQDDKWAERQRRGRPTDAILSCPSCFTAVCIECQEHATIHTQYRAVFTMNCEVETEADMRVPTRRGDGGGGSRKRREPGGASAGGGGGDAGCEEEVMHPVRCAACGTQVGAQDPDEVVHFYHVLASNP